MLAIPVVVATPPALMARICVRSIAILGTIDSCIPHYERPPYRTEPTSGARSACSITQRGGRGTSHLHLVAPFVTRGVKGSSQFTHRSGSATTGAALRTSGVKSPHVNDAAIECV